MGEMEKIGGEWGKMEKMGENRGGGGWGIMNKSTWKM